MNESIASVRPVLLVGSVPLVDERAVFTTVARILGSSIRSIPDGETGERTNWITWQLPRLAESNGLVLTATNSGPYASRPTLALATGAQPGDIDLVALGYAEAAIASYAVFSELKRAGTIDAATRFQVSLPTPVALLTYFEGAIQAVVLPLLEARLRADVDAIARAVPADELAIQWDVAIEFAVLELGLPMPFRDVKATLIEQLARIGGWVPAGVSLGYHFCYGDAGHKHFKEPADTMLLVEMANALAARSARSIEWLHLPVPIGRSDDAYFAPLAGLQLHSETTLYLGLVHASDGAAGTRARIRAGARHYAAFGIATECGMGRRPAASIESLLALHRSAAGD